MSEGLSLFDCFTSTLDSMAKLFQTRAAKAEENAKSSVRGNTQYWQGFAAAYEDAARECRNAATKLREP